ncbi:15601_t:CDS:2, partial [Acaulospora morrowiae]
GNKQLGLSAEMQELREQRLVNHEEIIEYISKYDKLIEVKEEGAEIREFMESLSEEKRKELYPTVDEFLRSLQNGNGTENQKNIKMEDQDGKREEDQKGINMEDAFIENEDEDLNSFLRESEWTEEDAELIESIKIQPREYRPGFEGRAMPKLVQIFESGSTDKLPKKFKCKLGRRQVNPRANSKIKKYVASYGFQPSPMLDG